MNVAERDSFITSEVLFNAYNSWSLVPQKPASHGKKNPCHIIGGAVSEQVCFAAASNKSRTQPSPETPDITASQESESFRREL